MKKTILLTLVVLGIAIPAQAQIFGGYGFGSGNRQSKPLPGPDDFWGGTSFDSYNGLCPVGTRMDKLKQSTGKYVNGVWKSSYKTLIECMTVDMSYDFVPANKDKTCWPGTTYASNGYCRKVDNVLRPIGGKCPKGGSLENDTSLGTYCATGVGSAGGDAEVLGRKVITQAEF